MATALKSVKGELVLQTPRVFLPIVAPENQHKRYFGMKGSRASGKSHMAAEIVIEECILQRGLRVLCARESQKSIKESAKKLLEDKIAAMGVGHLFHILLTEIRTPGGGTIIFTGLKDHTVESIKSVEGVKLVWLEEAETLSEKSITMLDPTIRTEGARVIATWNPRRRNAPIERLVPWHDEAVSVLVHANYTDNPFLDKSVIALAERHRRDHEETFAHVWLGDYESAGSKTVIPYAHVQAAIGLARKLGIEVTGKKIAALDVAGAEEGGDENGFVAMHGIQIEHVEKWNGLDTSMTTTRAVKLAVQHGCTELDYDSAGVGEGVTGEWAAMGRRDERPQGLTLVAWNGGSSVLDPDGRIDPKNPQSPKNKDHYLNLKAQAHFRTRRKFQNAYHASLGQPYDAEEIISISENIPAPILRQLCDELSQPQQELTSSGKIKIEKQPENARSPNIGDPVIMATNSLRPKSAYRIEAWG